MGGSGKVDKRFVILAVMEQYGWTYEQYLNRPLWFDAFYEMKGQADAKAQEQKSKSPSA